MDDQHSISSLLDLPEPLLQDIVYWTGHFDVVSLCMLSQTCTQLWRLIGMRHPVMMFLHMPDRHAQPTTSGLLTSGCTHHQMIPPMFY